jgi:hypothetical protein
MVSGESLKRTASREFESALLPGELLPATKRNGATTQSRSSRPGQEPQENSTWPPPLAGRGRYCLRLNSWTLRSTLAVLLEARTHAHAWCRVVNGPGPARSLLWSRSPWSKDEGAASARCRRSSPDATRPGTVRQARTTVSDPCVVEAEAGGDLDHVISGRPRGRRFSVELRSRRGNKEGR